MAAQRVCHAVDLRAAAGSFDVLDERERAHAERRHGEVRDRYVSAHTALRTILGAQLGCSARDIVYRYRCARCGSTEHGRPELASPDAACSFSLSHSGAVAVIAIAPERVGVDVELVLPRERLDRLSARVMSPGEYAGWDGELRSFLAVWTAKEAYLKQLGVGLTQRLRDVEPRGVQTFAGWPRGCITSVALDAPDAGSVVWTRR